MTIAVVIPFRDRGIDPLRRQNLTHVKEFWRGLDLGPVIVSSDGRIGNDQFNRSAAYNLGIKTVKADVYVFAESDMCLPEVQIHRGINMADQGLGLVVPFTEYHYLGPKTSEMVRAGVISHNDAGAQYVMHGGRSIGAINIVSMATIRRIRWWDEKFEGNWYDDDAMKIAFEVCAGPTRWVPGPAHHLYHLPGHRGDHLTKADKQATLANKQRLRLYELALREPDQLKRVRMVRDLTEGIR